METRAAKEQKLERLGKLGKVVKQFVKEAEQIEHETVSFSLQWPLRLV